MATEILMPRLGWTMEEGTFGAWLKEDGAVVKAGEMLFTVEGDKASQEVESFESGILRIPPNAPKPGDILPVGALLAYIVQPGEVLSFEQTAARGQKSEVSGQRTEVRSQRTEVNSTTSGQSPIRGALRAPQSPIAISPRARRVAGELGVDWSQLTGSGATGRIIERDIRAAAAIQKPPESKLRISPIAQRLAQASI
jgi:pyruvate dehydrogenase E2 component (dihydrolipoamide acetyltransferase)